MATKRPTSPVILGLNWGFFRSVPVGGRFRFALDVQGYGTKRGVCERISTRKYKYIDDGMCCQVGSLDAQVVLCDPVTGELQRGGDGPVVSVRD